MLIAITTYTCTQFTHMEREESSHARLWYWLLGAAFHTYMHDLTLSRAPFHSGSFGSVRGVHIPLFLTNSEILSTF